MNEENTKQNENDIEQKTEIKSAYKTFESREEFEKFIEDTKGKFVPELKSRLEKEAKMTAEQRLQSKIDELEKEKKTLAIDRNRTKAERLFVAKGIEEKAYNELLNFIVHEDENTTIERTNALLKFIDTASKMIADEKIKTTMKGVTKPKSDIELKQNDETGIAKVLGKIRASSEKKAQETVNKYF